MHPLTLGRPRRAPRGSCPTGFALALAACLSIAATTGWAQSPPADPAQGQPNQDQPAQTTPAQTTPGQPAQDENQRASQRPLFIDDAHQPMISIAWVQRDGTRIELARTLPWGTKNDRVDLGMNVLAFAAVGGTRIDLQRGHPLGSVVRVGFYKADPDKPFFANIQPGSTVEVRLEGVRFLEPARPTQNTALHHLQYSLDDVLNCGLDGSAIDQYNTAAVDRTLGGNVTLSNGRPGVLRVVRGQLAADAPRYFRQGGEPAGDKDPQPAERFASIRFSRDAQTEAISLRAELPYELFRHVRDPWLRTEPGTFFEPTHFHVEFESLPVRAISPEVLAEEDRQKRREEEEVVGP